MHFFDKTIDVPISLIGHGRRPKVVGQVDDVSEGFLTGRGMMSSSGLRRMVRGLLPLLLVLPFLIFAAGASAAAPEFLARMPASGVQPGQGAGELDNPRGIAASQATGHVYISDFNNARISEYTAWGLFVRSWGWDVAPEGAPGDTAGDQLEVCGPAEPEEAPATGLCKRGLEGSGRGQLSRPLGITLDGADNVYVFDRENMRVQKFDSAGDFLLMFGGNVNWTKAEEGAPASQRNVCPIDSGDICQAGTPGSGPSQFGSTVGNVIAYSSFASAVVVGGEGRIQLFNLDGTYREEISFTGPLASLAGKSVNGLAVASEGNIYFSVLGDDAVYKLGPTGLPLAPGVPGESKFTVIDPIGVAVDHKGNVYAIEVPSEEFVRERVVKFDPAGNRLLPTKAEEEAKSSFPYIPLLGPRPNGIATNICAGSPEPGNLYVSFFTFAKAAYVDAYGSGPIGCEPPPPRAPGISSQYAMSVGSEGGQVQALINPKFWPDATYYVEYGKGPCVDGGCTSKAPVPPAPLTKQATNKALKTAAVSLTGLEPGTTYYYRFVAESSGGGPVFGVDPDGEGLEEASFEKGSERRFRTLNPSRAAPGCTNDAFRSGAGAQLPDCRAYELVSPLDKEGGDVALWIGKHGLSPHLFELHQSAFSGERFSYSSSFSFGDSSSAPYVSQYLAERQSTGWSSRSLSPSRTELPVPATTAFSNEFHRLSPDLCTAWVRHYSVAPLAEGAIPAFPNLYRQASCTEPPAYKALSTAPPVDRESEQYRQLRVHGSSEDGSHTIFVANGKLHEHAPALPEEAELLLYESAPEGLRFVCYLPSGKPSPIACGAGTAAGVSGGEDSSVRNAISADGSRIFWTAFSGAPKFGVFPGAPGQIFVRVDGKETRKVSTSVAPDPAWYWTAADDGSKVIFSFDSGTHKDELYEFDVDAAEATLIAKGVEGPMGASEDASRLYFASTEDLDGGGPGSKGAHNLYFYDASGEGGVGSFTSVMALAASELTGTETVAAPIDEIPTQRSARVTADGLHVTFSSVAPPPSGYDNLEATSDEPAQEVYRYDAEMGELRCISCNPTGGRPAAEDIGGGGAPAWTAARIQGWEGLNHAPRVISDDGSRVFFESFEALVPRDTNGTWDVYQWEEPGKGSCDKADPTFGTESGGCVDLISSGESPAKSTFLDADPSGDNIFFSTQSSLVGQDYGLNDVYVARVGGGFPEPQPKPICEGDACQGPSAAPSPPTPSSSTYRGPEAVKQKPRCKRGFRRVKRAGKVRCVKKKRRGATRRRATQNKRRAAR